MLRLKITNRRNLGRPKRPVIGHWQPLTIFFVGLAILGTIYLLVPEQLKDIGGPGQKSETANSQTKPQPEESAIFDKSQYSTTNSASLWVVVNKGRKLPSDYVPADLVTPNIRLRQAGSSQNMQLRSDAAMALASLVGGAKSAGFSLMLASGYRSYGYQTSLYNGYVSSQGRTEADRTSARPGHSEHQTGLAADLEPASRVCEIKKCFGDMAEGQWLAGNAQLYGFVVRYPAGKESLTGYDYEPWHVRYVGVELATQLYNQGETLEQFMNLPSYPDYPRQIYRLNPSQ